MAAIRSDVGAAIVNPSLQSKRSNLNNLHVLLKVNCLKSLARGMTYQSGEHVSADYVPLG